MSEDEAYVFISYSRQDRDYVARLAEFLRTHDVPVWYDPDIPKEPGGASPFRTSWSGRRPSG